MTHTSFGIGQDLTDMTVNADQGLDWTQIDTGSDGTFSSGSTPSLVSSTALVQTLYVTEAGNTSAIAATDIHQGQLGDCFLLSSIGEIALFHPTFIQNMIHSTGTGSETVTMYKASNGSLPWFGTSSYKAAPIAVTNTFASNAVNNGGTEDVSGNQAEIWPSVLEKAAATLNGGTGYSSIANGGYPVVAMEELTGHAASYMSPSSVSLAMLQTYVAAGDLITMDTAGSGRLADGLVNSHCYMFGKVTGSSAASASVQLLNPWGYDNPGAISFSKLAASGIVEIDIGHVS